MPTPEPAVSTVTHFLAALEDLDIDRALSYAAPGIVYQNVPLPPARGLAAFEKQMRWLARAMTGFEVTIQHIVGDGPIVLTERTDTLRAGSWSAAFWVCGSFEVRDGRIELWRDYFDWATLGVASLRGLAQAAVAGISRAGGRTVSG